MPVTSQIRNELLDRGRTDMLQLGVIVSVVSRHLGRSMEDELVMESTLEAIRDLLNSGYVVAGYTARDGDGLLYVSSWEIPPADAVKRIEADWMELGRLPSLGEVVWLELTDAGRAKIESIRTLDPDEKRLVEDVIARRCPEMRERVAVSFAGQGKLNWKEREAIHQALAAELSVVHQDEAYAQQLTALIDRALVL